jgi:hypothetical protein
MIKIKNIIDLFISIIFVGVYVLLFCCFIYAMIDTLGGYGWISVLE